MCSVWRWDIVGGGCSQRIIHYFFLPQYFSSLICLLFFKLDPEPCPPAESPAQRRGGLSQLQAPVEGGRVEEEEEEAGGGGGLGLGGGAQKHTVAAGGSR